MARCSFGGGPADFVMQAGNGGYIRLASAQLYVWSAETGGTQLTDLVLNGSAVSTIPVGTDGQVPDFLGPDTGVSEVWVSAGATGQRLRLGANVSSATDAVVQGLLNNASSATSQKLAATYASIKADNARARLNVLAAADQSKSAALATIEYATGEEVAVTTWGTDDTAWTGTSADLTGTTTLRRTGTADTTPYRSAPITPPTASGVFTIDATIYNQGGGSGTALALYVGAGGQVGGELQLSELVGIGFDEGGYIVYTDAKLSGSTTPVRLSTSAVATGTYKVTIHADANTIGMTIGVASDHRNEWAVQIARGTFNPNKVFTWINDARLGSGSGVQQIGYKASRGTHNDGRTKSIGDRVFYAKGPNSLDPFRVVVPNGLDSRKQCPLVIYGHGSGEDIVAQWANTLHNPIKQGLVNRGAIFAQSNMGGLASWNNAASRAALLDTYRYVRDHWHIGPVFLLGISMGGIATLDALAGDLIPGVVGWYGIQPTASLANMYGVYPGPIETAFGFSGSGNYAAATAGRDPLLIAQSEPWRFRGVPMRATASPADTIVNKGANADALRTALLPHVPEFTVLEKTGDHGDPSMYDAADVLAFFDKCIGTIAST